MEPEETHADTPLVSPEQRALVEHVFKYHAPTPHQVNLYGEIRDRAKDLADIIVANCPASADRTAALRKVREAVMTANASIALDGKAF